MKFRKGNDAHAQITATLAAIDERLRAIDGELEFIRDGKEPVARYRVNGKEWTIEARQVTASGIYSPAINDGLSRHTGRSQVGALEAIIEGIRMADQYSRS